MAEKKETYFYKVERKGPREWIAVQKRPKEAPEIIPGTEIYLTRQEAFDAITRALVMEYRAWD